MEFGRHYLHHDLWLPALLLRDAQQGAIQKHEEENHRRYGRVLMQKAFLNNMAGIFDT